jgi:hypothetical protein
MNPNINHIRSRFTADIILFFTVLFAPWWFAAIAVFVCILRFKSFYEAFFFGLLFDILYGANIARLHQFRFISSSLSLFLIFAVDFIRAKLRT